MCDPGWFDDCPPDCATACLACSTSTSQQQQFCCFCSAVEKQMFTGRATASARWGLCINEAGMWSLSGTDKLLRNWRRGVHYLARCIPRQQQGSPFHQQITPFAAGLVDAFNDNVRRLHFPFLFTSKALKYREPAIFLEISPWNYHSPHTESWRAHQRGAMPQACSYTAQ